MISGASFGGYLVIQQLATHPERWRAGVDLFGIVDFHSFIQSTTGLVRQNYLLEIGDPERDREFLIELSPFHRIEHIKTPLFVYAGANDPRVPKAQSDMLVERLRANNVPVEYMLAAHEGHGASAIETRKELMLRSMRFILSALDMPANELKNATDKP